MSFQRGLGVGDKLCVTLGASVCSPKSHDLGTHPLWGIGAYIKGSVRTFCMFCTAPFRLHCILAFVDKQDYCLARAKFVPNGWGKSVLSNHCLCTVSLDLSQRKSCLSTKPECKGTCIELYQCHDQHIQSQNLAVSNRYYYWKTKASQALYFHPNSQIAKIPRKWSACKIKVLDF